MALPLAILLLGVKYQRARRVPASTLLLAGPLIYLVIEPAIRSYITRDQSDELLSTLTGRTKAWERVHQFPRSGFVELFGVGYGDKSIDGLPIDSGYLSTFHELGRIGVVTVCAVMVVFLLRALFYPKTANRALAVFLVVFVAVASYTETGIGDMSAYVLHLVLAGALLTPAVLVSRAASDSYVPHSSVAQV